MIRPSYLIQEVTSRCRAGCQSCFRTLIPDFPEGDMSDEVFDASLEGIESGTMVCGALHGEPMLHPKFPVLLERWKNRGLRIGLPLSGFTTRFIPQMLEKDSPVYSVLVSCDGITDATQSSHRGCVSLRMVERFVDDCLYWRRNDAFIGVRMTQNGQSEQEFELFLKHWLLKVGVDVVCRAKWTDYKVKGSPSLGERCHVITQGVPTITWDGDVLLCERVPDRKRYVLGNVLKEPLDVILTRVTEHDCCKNCSLRIVDCGMKGVMQFRHGPDTPIYWHSDAYQQFFSLKKSESGITWGNK
jgi:MoaA/NifB/PqqE/SkfB family radical SAM enzyme